jgi:PIN domain nuclease of toxin-antitoxin system
VNLVVDTHVLVWHLSGQDRRLNARVRQAFSAADSGSSRVHVPVAVLIELVLLEQLGRLRVSYRTPREQLALRPGFPLEAITPEDVDEVRGRGVLVDPFDRLIVGTALRLGLPLITRDELITSSKASPDILVRVSSRTPRQWRRPPPRSALHTEGEVGRLAADALTVGTMTAGKEIASVMASFRRTAQGSPGGPVRRPTIKGPKRRTPPRDRLACGGVLRMSCC